MAIGLEDKKAIVSEVNETATSAMSLVIADSRGCTVDEMTALRSDARENQIKLRVVRNTLAKRAFEGTEYECVSDALSGPSLFGFSMEDPGAAAYFDRGMRRIPPRSWLKNARERHSGNSAHGSPSRALHR